MYDKELALDSLSNIESALEMIIERAAELKLYTHEEMLDVVVGAEGAYGSSKSPNIQNRIRKAD